MPYAKTSLRKEKRELRERMRALGLDYRQIATEFARTYHLRPRTAWREAYGLSQTEASQQFNAFCGENGLDPNGLSSMTAAHLCEYENWPGHGTQPTGRKPSPYLLAVLAAMYHCQVNELVDLADRSRLPPDDLLVIDTYSKPENSGRAPVQAEMAPISGQSPAGDSRKVPNPILRHVREQERHETRGEFAEALELKAREMGESVHPSERYVARLEDGDIRYPHPAYRRVLVALCRRSMRELGFAPGQSLERSYNERSGERHEPRQDEREDDGELLSGWSAAFLTDIEDAMKRREFLLSLAASAGLSAAGLSPVLETIRHDVNLSLAQHHATTDVEEWREIALEYGQTYPITAPAELLRSLMVDLHGLKAALGRYHDDLTQRELRRVGALLSAFTAQTVANLGYLRDARRWWRTARHAADESEDRYTMVWTRGREIVRAGYEHRPLTVILQLIEETEARIGGAPPIRAMPEFLSGKAQTLALMGQPAASDAESSLKRLHESFDALPPPMKVVGDSMFTWGEERLRFTESMVYTYLGEFRKADTAQTTALALYPKDDLRSPAQIELQRALCLVTSGDVLHGIRHAQSIIRNLPDVHRVRPVDDLSHKVLRAVPVPEQRHGDVQAYRECLSLPATAMRTQLA